MTKVVFLGSGPVAAEALELLLQDFEIEAVITKPRPPRHKGRFPVLDVAEEHKLDTVLVSTGKELDVAMKSHRFDSQMAILIDFGIIVSKTVIDAFPLGIINSHFSLLPALRGADPITFALLSGQAKTGVSLMLIDEGMDTGKILKQKTLSIDTDDTNHTLTKKLIALSHELLTNHVEAYLKGKLKPRQQSHPDRATYSRKITKQDGVIDWHKPADQLEREVRAFLGWPGSKTTLADKEVTITSAHAVPSAPQDSKPGEVNAVVPETNEIAVTAGDHTSLWITKLKPAGKREMTAKEFVAGHKDKLI